MPRPTKRCRLRGEHALRFAFAVILAVVLAPLVARADGGVVLARQTQGPFSVTLFAPPDAARHQPTDLAVMVQKRDTGEIVMDATVTLGLVPPADASLQPDGSLCGLTKNPLAPPVAAAGQPPTFQATHRQSANKLLYGTSIVFPATGDWQLRATVRQGNEEVSVTCSLPVGTPPRRLATLWPYLALPPVAILLFGLNQWLRRQPSRTAAVSAGPAAATPNCQHAGQLPDAPYAFESAAGRAPPIPALRPAADSDDVSQEPAYSCTRIHQET